MNTKIGYNKQEVVEYYVGETKLQKVEQVLFESVEDLKTKSLLDIGIGAGKTTHFFESRAGDYYGIDYASAMIDASKLKFPALNKENRLRVGDVRDLSDFKDNTFDLVIFSFNGLDHIDIDERIIALKEMHRVLKPNGELIFSSHNLLGASKIFRLKWFINPIMFARSMRMVLRRNLANPNWKKLLDRDYSRINDFSYGVDDALMYVKPNFQKLQLLNLGFDCIQMYDFDGREFSSNTKTVNEIQDLWIYFKAKKIEA